MGLPDDECGRVTRRALLGLLPEEALRLGRIQGLLAVHPSQAKSAIAVLQHFYDQIDVLAPEAVGGVLQALGNAGPGPLDGLTPELVERAYRALARVLHPDVGGSTEAFVRLQRWKDGQGGGA